MKKLVHYGIYLIAVLAISPSISAQGQFELLLPPPPALQGENIFDGVTYGALDIADIDADGDYDVLITGESEDEDYTAKLYTNDGNGVFVEVLGTPFEGVSSGSVAFVDIDGDGDQDVLISGNAYDTQWTSQTITKLYENDGNGVFTELSGTPFHSYRGVVAFADVDGDNDLDFFISGRDSSVQAISKIFINDSTGVFTEMQGTSFPGPASSAAFADVDGDGDSDLLVSGQQSVFQSPFTKLFINDGSGSFSEVAGTTFTGVSKGTINFADTDGDGDQDVLITGEGDYTSQIIAKLYSNDGTGVFTEVTGTPFVGVRHSSVEFIDVDGDGDDDVMITGQINLTHSSVNLYTNDGTGIFTLNMGLRMDPVKQGDLAFADIDGDNDQDVLIIGETNVSGKTAKVYTNNGNGIFTVENGSLFHGNWSGDVDFEDIDGDGDQDLLVYGRSHDNLYNYNLYINNGGGSFVEMAGTPFDYVYQPSIHFLDLDSDGDKDVLITAGNGMEEGYYYLNQGNGVFVESSNSPFEGLLCGADGCNEFADVDGDGDLDLLTIGKEYDYPWDYDARLYINNGAGMFSLMQGTPFETMKEASIAFADIDGDNDLDVLVVGDDFGIADPHRADLYTNDGNGVFSKVQGTPFEGVSRGSVAFADVDGDNDQDVFIIGRSLGYIIAKFYINDGTGSFTEMMGNSIDGASLGDIAFSDVDNDGDQDLLITGEDDSFGIITKLYINDGSGIFTEQTNAPFDNVWRSAIDFTDIDGDGDEDVLISGLNIDGQMVSKMYLNTGSLGAFQFIEETRIGLYPNPTRNGVFNIEMPNTAGRAHITIYDLSGKVVFKESRNVTSTVEQVNAQNLPTGIFIVYLQQGEDVVTGKIIVQK